MTLPRGRLVRAGRERAVRVDPPGLPPSFPPAGRLIKHAVAQASHQSAAMIREAEARAFALLAEAHAQAHKVREEAREEGTRDGAAALAAGFIKLRAQEASTDARHLDRTIELARAMAERLLGEELALSPAKIAALARQALASARQARRIDVRAHPDDAGPLLGEVKSLGLEDVALEIHADATLSRGSLVVDTDLGTLDANLSVQLDRLARTLRDSFPPR